VLAAGQPAPDAYPYDPTNGVKPDADPFPTGAESGKIVTQPDATAQRLSHPALSWQGGQRGFDRPLGKAFVSVQRRVTVKVKVKAKRPKRRPRRHTSRQPVYAGRAAAAKTRFKTVRRWKTVDSDLGLNMLWSVDANGLYSAHWEVPLDAPKGDYRFVVSANRYGLTTSRFKVAPSRALTAVQVNAEAGHVAAELRYPAAAVREGVGDPAGDLTADLTYRPAGASSGRATFLVNRKPVTVEAGSGGVFSVPAPAGAQVVLQTGEAADKHGNANGNQLTLSP
jgi:hypothetical protein